MSRRREAVITCPKCHKEHPFVTWDSINVSLDLEMKDAVLDRSAFLFECPDCGEKTNVNYRTLYHDMEKQVMIQYAITDEDADNFYKTFTDIANDSMYARQEEYESFDYIGYLYDWDTGKFDRID